MNYSTINLLGRSLDASSLRQQTIADNIANVHTADYKAKRVVFEDVLKDTLTGKQTAFVGKRTHPKHLPIGSVEFNPTPSIKVEDGTVMGNNGNNVDIDYEMSQLAKNSIWYNALTHQINHEFNKMNIAIKGRGN